MSAIDLQFGAVIGLLHDPLSRLTQLNVERFRLDNNHMQPLSESMRHNTRLENLSFFLNHNEEGIDLTPIKNSYVTHTPLKVSRAPIIHW